MHCLIKIIYKIRKNSYKYHRSWIVKQIVKIKENLSELTYTCQSILYDGWH